MIRYLYLAGCLLLNIVLRAQAPVAAFTSTGTSGCSPLNVTFTDQSTGSPVFWNWEFGNGQLSTLQNPSVTFNTPGKYTVKLVVRNANGTNGITKTDYITVLPSPSPAFSSDRTVGCQPVTINFKDASTSSTGTINGYEWTFGDGGTSTQKDPSHSYKDNGFYTVTLKVSSTSGCSGTASSGRYVRVVSGVKAGFKSSVDSTCSAPFNARFTNQTSGPGTLSYLWRFSDGTTASNTDPAHLYNAAGTYNVKLIATSDLGCSDSIQTPLTVTGANVQFTLPAGACVNSPVTFSNTSPAGALSVSWDFGDGTSSSQSSPVKTYLNAGTYQVAMTSIYSFCSSTVTRQLTVVDPPTVDFSADKTTACKPALSVNFASSAPDAVKWAWDFGDGGTATTENPLHVYTTTGEFNVTLTVTNATNCISTVTKNTYIKIALPAITMPFPAELCVNDSYQPTSNIAIASPDPVASYTWSWGDGTPDGTGINAAHAYTAQGTYQVGVTVVTVGGCTVSASFPGAVLVGDKIVADFTSDKTLICDLGAVQFTNTSSINGTSPKGDKFLWTFSDGQTSDLENPMHSFSGVDKYSATLKIRNIGCYDTKTKVDIVEVLPPTAKFDFKLVDCNDPYTYTFVSTSDTSMPPVTSQYIWQFNGGVGNTTDANTTVKFPALASYVVTLKVTDNSTPLNCSSTETKTVRVFKEAAILSASKLIICKNETVHITAAVSQPANIAYYQWQVNGSAPILKKASWDTSFAAAGNYSITATLTDINGCQILQNAPLDILVQGPVAKLDIPVFKACRNTSFNFTDQSTAVAGISSWMFNWGDGKSDTYTTLSTPFSHTYADSGKFTIRYTVTDKNGCPDILDLTDTIKIRQPVAGFKAASTLFCRNGKLQFTDTSKGHGLTYLWDFGDGQTSTDQNPVQVYQGADKKYAITLQVKDDAGCSDQKTVTDYIEIKSPKPAFTVSDSISLCQLFETKFVFAGKDYESFSWDFGDAATSTAQDPTHFYNNFGNYTAKLYLTGYGGCVDSAVHSIQLLAANGGMLNYTVPPSNCNELLVNFTLIPPPGVSFAFIYGDNAFDTSKNLSLSHTYKSLASYTPGLQMIDNQGCISIAYGNSPINIIGALPFYSQDRKKFCDAGAVVFTEFIQKNDPVTSFTWQFGDGSSLSDQNAIHSYNTPGTYITSLSVTTTNCPANTYYDTVRVYRTPVPSITSADNICINDLLTLEGVLAVADTATVWTWNFGNNKTGTGPTVSTTYSDSGNFTINMEATNLLGCKGSTSKIIAAKPLPDITVLSNPAIPVRTDITMPVSFSSNVTTFKWTPDKSLSCTDCATPVASPQFTTKYNVAVVDEFGCKSSKDITITVICNELNYFIPNTFSPNADGSNDVFYPRGKGLYNIVSLRIFNRWGEQVFEKRNFSSNDAASGWNGTYKGKTAPAEVYMYIMEVICDNAQIIPLKGNVTLLR